MELYVQVSFWIGLLGVVVSMVGLNSATFPRTEVETVGSRLFKIIVQGGFALWGASVLGYLG